MEHFPSDIWEYISRFLDSDDLFAMSATCKRAYKAFKRPLLQEKISWPLNKPKRLTADQREIIQKMEKGKCRVKLICGGVGSGKTIVSLAYAMRKISNQERIYEQDKIILVVPPNLIRMWEDSCINFFGISPLVIHNSNKNYNWKIERDRTEPPEQKIILFSYKNFDKGEYFWLNKVDKILIVDEAHHYVYFRYDFNEVLALSATPFKDGNITFGIRNLMGNCTLGDITFNLEKNIIASKLPPVINVEAYKWRLKNEKVATHILKNTYKTKNGNNDLVCMNWIPNLLTHIFIEDNLFLGDSITVNKKKFNIPLIHRNQEYWDCKNNFFIGKDHLPFDKKMKKELDEYMEENSRKNVDKAINSCVKYKQCLSILKYVKQLGEKAVIFDVNISYLPFLHKYLTDNEINSYMFTTHYDVASRQRQLEKFKNSEDAHVLLSSVNMLGEGHNVTEANHVIFLTNMTDKNKYYQGIGRCHRYPQNKNVYVYYMFNSEMDEKIYKHSMGEANLGTLDWSHLLE